MTDQLRARTWPREDLNIEEISNRDTRDTFRALLARNHVENGELRSQVGPLLVFREGTDVQDFAGDGINLLAKLRLLEKIGEQASPLHACQDSEAAGQICHLTAADLLHRQDMRMD